MVESRWHEATNNERQFYRIILRSSLFFFLFLSNFNSLVYFFVFPFLFFVIHILYLLLNSISSCLIIETNFFHFQLKRRHNETVSFFDHFFFFSFVVFALSSIGRCTNEIVQIRLMQQQKITEKWQQSILLNGVLVRCAPNLVFQFSHRTLKNVERKNKSKVSFLFNRWQQSNWNWKMIYRLLNCKFQIEMAGRKSQSSSRLTIVLRFFYLVPNSIFRSFFCVNDISQNRLYCMHNIIINFSIIIDKSIAWLFLHLLLILA